MKTIRNNDSTIQRFNAGFTLIELLVVIAIIGIVAALLMPALSKSKQRAQMITCTSNMKQSAMAVHMFAGDNDDYLPPGQGGTTLMGRQNSRYTSGYGNAMINYIATYIGGPAPETLVGKWSYSPVFICPAAVAFCPNYSTPLLLNNNIYTYERMPTGLASTAPSTGKQISFDPFVGPHKLSECTPDIWGGLMPWLLTDMDNPFSVPNVSLTHINVRNYNFFDGHVEAKRILIDIIGVGYTGNYCNPF